MAIVVVWVDVMVSNGERRECFSELRGRKARGVGDWWWREGGVLDEGFFTEGMKIYGGGFDVHGWRGLVRGRSTYE